jgi:hypothetical protein
VWVGSLESAAPSEGTTGRDEVEIVSLQKLYLETTIPSYLTARRSANLRIAADQEATEDWWNNHRQKYECHISQVVLREVRRGDAAFAAARLACLTGLPLLEESEAALSLTETLLLREIIPAIATEDAAHVGLAAAHGMDVLLTWNCKHSNNPFLLFRIQAACESVGLKCPAICTPTQLMNL